MYVFWKNRTILFPKPFISTSEKIGVGLKKQAAIFYFNFTRRRVHVVQYSCFDFISVQNKGIFSYLGYIINLYYKESRQARLFRIKNQGP